MKHRLSLKDIQKLTMMDWLVHVDFVLSPYEAKEGEDEEARLARYDRILDEMPDIYAWFTQCRAVFDWLTDRNKELYGQSDMRYKEARQRRDSAKDAIESAKLRYQGASRSLTVILDKKDEQKFQTYRK